MDNTTETQLNILQEKLDQLVAFCKESGHIDPNLYSEYDVKRGLRDSTGKGVLTGLTEISDVVAYELKNGHQIPANGRLYFQGYDVEDLIEGAHGKRFCFEEITYLLMFGELPNSQQLNDFIELLTAARILPSKFVRDVIMKAPSANLMNALQRSVLTLYSYDQNPDSIEIGNVLRQSLKLIATFPLIAVYAYGAHNHYHNDKALVIRNPESTLSIAENLLQILRIDGKFTPLEAQVLDVCLILHAEHGGGNNSTFTTHVVSSSGTDTYSAVAASLASLKGPKHGGANLKVSLMFEDLKANIENWEDEDEIKTYLLKILDKQAFDHTGLIYGMGHAVYTLSDPRCVILKRYAAKLAEAKGRMAEFEFMSRVENLAGDLVAQKRNVFKKICANVDFYSGFVYSMLDIPYELYTPLFAIARISGWCAHRMEELVNAGKIIRPAYKYVGTHKNYYALEDRFW
ncbi:MAG: citrate/2-methylcitrate synthase [Lachnospiraceae bacterium]|nr:citrate/2-methylcitrate synthase [Lachnospiraceae bacterium]